MKCNENQSAVRTSPVIDNQVADYTDNYKHSKRCSNENSVAVAVFYNNMVCFSKKYIVDVNKMF